MMMCQSRSNSIAPSDEQKKKPCDGDVLRKQAGNSELSSQEKIELYEDALAAYDRDLEENDQSHAGSDLLSGTAPLFYGKGVTLRKMGREVLAIEALDEALLRGKASEMGAEFRFGPCHDNKGAALLKLARYKEALEEFTKACKCEPENKTYQARKSQAEIALEAARKATLAASASHQAKREVASLRDAMKEAIAEKQRAEQDASKAALRASEAERMAKSAEAIADKIESELNQKKTGVTFEKDADHEPCIEDYELILNIGDGASATVFAGCHRVKKEPVAIKKISKNTDAVEPWRILQEKEIMEVLHSHPFVVSLTAAFQDQDALYFVLDYCPGGDLFGYMSDRLQGLHKDKKHKSLDEDETRLWSAELVLALGHLHEQKIAYRDLKPENVLIGGDGHICIADFGLSRQEGSTGGSRGHYSQAAQEGSKLRLFSVVGTPEYMAPEILLKKGSLPTIPPCEACVASSSLTDPCMMGAGHGYAVDWWALGVLMCEMMFGLGTLPFGDSDDQMAMFQRILSEEPTLGRDCCIALKVLIKKMLNKDENERITYEQIKKHSFFNSIAWDSLEKKELYSTITPDVPEELITSWREKRKKNEGGDEIWSKFGTFARGSVTSGKSPREDTSAEVSVEELKAKARSFLTPFLSQGTTDAECNEMIGEDNFDPAATFILQGTHYTGGDGYLDYRNKLQESLSLTEASYSIQVQRTHLVGIGDVEVTWSYALTQELGGVQTLVRKMAGSSVFSFNEKGACFRGFNSYRALPLGEDAKHESVSRTLHLVPDEDEPVTAGPQDYSKDMPLRVQRAMEFAMLSDSFKANHIEAVLARILDPNVVSEGNSLVSALSEGQKKESAGSGSLPASLVVALGIYGTRKLFTQKSATLRQIVPYPHGGVRIEMMIKGTTRGDTRTLRFFKSFQCAGNVINGPRQLDFPVVLELEFGSDHRITHIMRMASQALLVSQLNRDPPPYPPLGSQLSMKWSKEQMKEFRAGSMDIFRKALFPHSDKKSDGTTISDIDKALWEVLDEEICVVCPDLPLMQVDAAAMAMNDEKDRMNEKDSIDICYIGKTRVREAFSKVRRSIMGGWNPDNMQVESAATWCGPDEVEIHSVTTGTFDISKSIVFPRMHGLDMEVTKKERDRRARSGTADLTEDKTKMRAVFRFGFVPNTRYIRSCTICVFFKDFLHQLGVLPHNEEQRKATAEGLVEEADVNSIKE